jgi:hypothetical protein
VTRPWWNRVPRAECIPQTADVRWRHLGYQSQSVLRRGTVVVLVLLPCFVVLTWCSRSAHCTLSHSDDVEQSCTSLVCPTLTLARVQHRAHKSVHSGVLVAAAEESLGTGQPSFSRQPWVSRPRKYALSACFRRPVCACRPVANIVRCSIVRLCCRCGILDH